MSKVIGTTNIYHNLTLLKPIKRVAGCFLHSHDGHRYLDLYMINGTATMGHRPTNFGLALKNPIDQGLTMAYPNLWHNRLKKELEKSYPAYNIGLYAQESKELLTLRQAAVEPWHHSSVGYLRPLYDDLFADVHILLSTIPASFLTIILSKKPLTCSSQIIPAFIARAALRFVHRRDVLLNQKIIALFDQYPKLWQRHQCYITSTLSHHSYQQFFEVALKNFILLPPSIDQTGLIPSTLSDGDYKRLKNIFDDFS